MPSGNVQITPDPAVAGNTAWRKYAGVPEMVGAVVAAVSTTATPAPATGSNEAPTGVDVNVAPTVAERIKPTVPATPVVVYTPTSYTVAGRAAPVRSCTSHAAVAPDVFVV